ncbi:uncharacterized protein LOC132205254 [Neocloeon triangulifer]|uniref:uncharacterized protein LOC132205254 n=1 Tax=Neocloeon triangulifer TaxID=2078957 RepID=UPI00286F7256|nr:uncharacterized protein LOC132205254 [Neocloeon triangulifer]
MVNTEQEICDEAFESQDFTWRVNGNAFECLAKCNLMYQLSSGDFSVRKPKYFERVFTPIRPTVNCLKETQDINSICKVKTKGLELKQYMDLPLVYFPLNVKLKKFEAEKFCQRRGLRFGIEESISEIVTFGITDIKIWTSDIGFKFDVLNKSKALGIDCKILHKQGSSITIKPENCGNVNNFVCVVPDGCHANRCSSKCPTVQCGTEIKRIEKCESNCPSPECGEEAATKFEYKPGDGDFIEMCGRQYLISKLATHSLKSASVFCCTKHMSLASVSTDLDSKCLARELIKRNYTDNSFWTGGRLGSCPDTYFWCPLDPVDGTTEVVDKDALQWFPPSSNPNKPAITITVVNKSETLQFALENKDMSRKALCVRDIPSKCQNSFCHPVAASEEVSQAKKFKSTGFYRFSCVYGYACKKIYDINPGQKYIYYQTVKWSMTNVDYKMRMITIETKEKLECLLDALRTSGVKSNTFFVAANSFGCPKSIRWCNGVNNPLMDDSFIPWDVGEPSMDLNKDCVYAKYNAGKNELTFGKTSCINSTLSYISETDPIYESKTLMANNSLKP